METLEQLKEEFLTCIICHEVFRDPVTLHCGHTFCDQCVTAYTKTKTQAIDDKTLPCPCCREVTRVPDPTKPVEEWTRQLRTGFFVKGLVDTFAATVKDDIPCSSCKADGETVPAVVWCGECEMSLCSSCQKAHSKFMKTHDVDDLTKWNFKIVPKQKKRLCREHSDSVVDMYCKSCDEAVCPRCCIEHHRKCESVMKLSQAMVEINQVLQKKEESLNTEIERRKKEIPLKELQIKTLEESAETAKSEVKVYCQKISEEVMKTFNLEVQQHIEIAKENLTADLKSERDGLQLAEQSRDLVQRALKSTSDMDHYEIYKTSPQDDRLPYPHPSRIIKLEFSHLKSNVKLVHCRSKFDDRLFIGSKTQAHLIEKLDFKFSEDLNKPFLYDIVLIDEEGETKIIVSDRANMSLKLITHQGSRKKLDSLKFVHSPHTIVSLPNSKLALPLGSKEIHIISLKPCLAIESSIKTSKTYVGLAALSPSTFVATDTSANSVEVIDMSGNVLRLLRPGIFTHPCYISQTNPKHFIVSDWKRRSITYLTSKGEIANTCKSTNKLLKHPWGVTRSSAGECFLVDRGANKVLQITDTGEYVKDVLTSEDGLLAPQCIHVDDRNLMYVSVDERYIYVYQFL